MTESAVASRRAQRSAAPTKGDRQERALVDAGARALAAGTAETVSIVDLARSAGISRAAFYFYFASKQALFATVVDETVSGFSAQLAGVAAREDEHPSLAVRATVDAAARLWWEHAPVMLASVTLASAMPEMYERSMQNVAAVREPTVALLERYGTVPEASNHDAAVDLVTALILMCERSFFDLMRGTPTAGERERLVGRLTTIWLRSFGIVETP